MNHKLNQFLKWPNFWSILYNNIVTYFPFPTYHSPYKWNVMLEIQSIIQNSNYNIPMIICYLFLQKKKKKNIIVKEKQQIITKVSSGTSTDSTLMLKAFRYRNK